MKRYPQIKIIVFFALITAFFLIHLFGDITSFLNPERLQNMLNSAGKFAPLLFICIMALAVVISPIPSLPLDIAAGAAFGPLLGTLYSVAGGFWA